jgi:hypothetical protein
MMMRALKDFTYDSRQLHAGESFETVEHRPGGAQADRRVLLAAQLAVDDDPTAFFEERPKKNRYKRRDMRAEE